MNRTKLKQIRNKLLIIKLHSSDNVIIQQKVKEIEQIISEVLK